MNSTKRHIQIFRTSVLALLVACMVAVQPTRSAARLAADAIAGTVSSAHGAEAGVWVIAETHDFQTRFAKIVVTDKAGRYLIPELPTATYSVWVRGYGLADSPRVDATPGHALDLTALIAPDAGVALQERVVSSRGQRRSRGVKRKMSNFPLRPRGGCGSVRIEFAKCIRIVK